MQRAQSTIGFGEGDNGLGAPAGGMTVVMAGGHPSTTISVDGRKLGALMLEQGTEMPTTIGWRGTIEEGGGAAVVI